MPSWLKVSTSVDVGIGPFLDETDGKTAETTLTITQPDIRLKKNGGAWAQKAAAQTLSHEENGWYEVTLDATDTNTLGLLIVAIHETGALPVWKEYMVVPAMIYDSIVAGTDRLDTNVTHVGDTAQTARDLGASVLLSPGTGTGQISLSSGAVTVGTNNDKTGYSLSQTFPTNFSALAITAAGKVTVGTNDDKTGYSLSQTFPTNFSSLAITAAGKVTVGTNDDKTGYTASTVSDKTGYALTSAYDPAKTAAQAGDAMTLTAAYDAAKTAATQASVDAVDDLVDTEVAAIKTVVDAIKVKTDSLTFTKAGEVDANIQSVNDTTVNGDGGTGTEWGP